MATESTHFNNWPNAAGFQVEAEQREPVELKVTGKFPSAAAGTLLRTGPSSYKAGKMRLSHWFDGFTQVYRFQLIEQPDGSCKVMFNSRRQVDAQLEKARQTGRLEGFTFGQKRDPCVGFFGKLKAMFEPGTDGLPNELNIGVTIRPSTRGADGELEARTDSATSKILDSETLEPIGLSDQTKLHPDLVGPLSCAHAQLDPANGDSYNYNLHLGLVATYRVFRTSAQTGETDIIATFTGVPKYVHSFMLTENYVVLCLWTAQYTSLKLLWERNLLDAINPFDPKVKAQWFVIDRKGGRGLVKQFESPAMFCFHTINAFEQTQGNGSTGIIADLIEYPTLDVLHKLYYDNLVSNSAGAKAWAGTTRGDQSRPRIARYHLSNISNAQSWNAAKDKAVVTERVVYIDGNAIGELPTMHPDFKTKQHRYVYGICDRGLSSFSDGIAKTDMQTQQTTYWSRDKHTPGEAIFVVDPRRPDHEDGGWLLSCVLDGELGTSYLLCLDAATMTEVARAEGDASWGIGFHGTHVPGRL
ncbi:hypothetical protein BAUCODRAFT_63561 [Baudoinia panamericana UAMH 10762]|uniref:Carotenoid oxygenase n=1 Tax=Baudoinia panamericana (strain UAMH 10762) TaxID=717646 RepID=M2N815_BAUPA|nr:uncharacterized protein BAUCODRAFT_63561 [Baudoinia panamericana UAMH 10762]EMD00259.1 hypothetical protein BAUCODRAFT_63561 [Baudoinia panamericana UAMH 10762]